MADSVSSKLHELGLAQLGVASPLDKLLAHMAPPNTQPTTTSDHPDLHEHVLDSSPYPPAHSPASECAGGSASGPCATDRLVAGTSASALHAIPEEVTQKDLTTLYRHMVNLMMQGKPDEALVVALQHEPKFNKQWIGMLPAGTRPLSCCNELQESMCWYFTGSRTCAHVGRGLDRLYLQMARCCIALGQISRARCYLKQALTLNPVSVDALLDLEALETRDCHFEVADTLVADAYLSTTNALDFARVYRRWGYHCTRKLEFELAYHCYAYARKLGSDADDQDCIQSMQNIKNLGYTPEKEPSEQEVITYLKSRGWPTSISDLALRYALTPVNEALEGGPLPCLAHIVATIAQRQAQGGNVRDLHSLLTMVTPMPFSIAALSDYLYKPVVLYDYPYNVGKQDKSPQANEEDTRAIAIPYIDTHAGLMFEVFASYCPKSKTVQAAMPPTQRATLSAEGFEHGRFLVLREQDHAELNVAQRCRRIAETHATTPQRDATRMIHAVDPLRNFTNPDDILVILCKPGLDPEGVWMTLEREDADGSLHAKLATEPFEDFGMHAGDVRRVKLGNHRFANTLVAFIDA